ncbi:MAG: ATP-binding protein, partial [Balneolaceae bacterium]|nr:ATP-binding protein [Balneolaceae bacterium]
TDQFTTDDGLPANTVPAILQDGDGFIWISTVEGQPQSPRNGSLSRFNPASISFANFTRQAGLPDIGFSMSGLKTTDGLLFFGGIGGLTFFDPAKIQDPVYESPKIALTGLQISNEQITLENSDLISRPLYLENSLELSHDQNDLTIDYKAFAYINTDQVQYQYKLEPYDSDWISARTQQNARYSQLPPGDYLFRVRTVDSRGRFNTEEATIAISILYPWWRTWWAYGLYVLLLALGVFAVDRFQRRRLISKERERARERELEQEKKYSKQLQDAYTKLEESLTNLKAAQQQLVQQEKLASLGQLTAGIAHEIKNPLNFVNNFSDVSIELVEEAREEVKRQKAEGKSKTGDGRRETEESPFEGGAGVPASVGTEVGDEAESGNDSSLSIILEILEDIETNLRKIHEHGSRADGIVKSMLMHSRGGDGKPEPTPLNPLIKEYVNLAFHGMRAGDDPINVDINFDLDESIGDVNLVAEDFSRVILNLCNNAFDAMREKLSEKAKGKRQKSPFEGGKDGEAVQGDDAGPDYNPKLIVQTRKSDKSVSIEIEDNGPGIPADIMDKILQPFFTTKKGTAGTGLGLSITNDIVKAHGGSLNIRSADGEGSTFIIELNNR